MRRGWRSPGQLNPEELDWFVTLELPVSAGLPEDGPIPVRDLLRVAPALDGLVPDDAVGERLFGIQERGAWQALLVGGGGCSLAPDVDVMHRTLRVPLRQERLEAPEAARELARSGERVYTSVVHELRGEPDPPKTVPMKPAHGLLGLGDKWSKTQGYLNEHWKASYVSKHAKGLDVAGVWDRPGGLGQGVDVTVIEGGFVTRQPSSGDPVVTHPDLAVRVPLVESVSVKDPREVLHGMSTLGVLAAEPENGRGLRGIVPRANFQALTPLGKDGVTSTPRALARAIKRTSPGGVIVLAREDKVANMPLEADVNYQRLYRLAAHNCITVVAAWGNGKHDLDGTFGWTNQHNDPLKAPGDNLSIRVAAADPTTRKRLRSSNYGRGVSAYAWGACVTTFTQTAYRSTYSNTSAATALVAGAAALVQALWMHQRPPPLTHLSPRDLRFRLYDKGRPSTGVDPIGRMPSVTRTWRAF